MRQLAEMSVEEMLAEFEPHPDVVYLIGNTEFWFCKIGKSRNAWSRLMALDSPKLPFPLEVMSYVCVGEAASWVEKKLHEAFKDFKVRGEWFRAIDEKEFKRKAKALHRAYLRGER